MFTLGFFDGIRSNSENTGIIYSDMTCEDYLLSSMHLATTGLTYEGIRNDKTKGYGKFLMHILSDASNTYMIQMKLFNIEGLYDWNNANIVITTSIRNKISDLEDYFDTEDVGNCKQSHEEIVKVINKAVKDKLKS